MNRILRARIPRRDIDLKRDVLVELEESVHDQGEDCVEVSVRQGLVLLTGCASSRSARDGMERAARRVPGVTSVTSELSFCDGAAVRDACITGAVNRALRRNRLLVGAAITPTVEDGWVSLEGNVELPYQPSAAVAAINRLPGVRGVTNRIRTCASSPPRVRAGSRPDSPYIDLKTITTLGPGHRKQVAACGDRGWSSSGSPR